MQCRNSCQSWYSPSPHWQGGVREGRKTWRFLPFYYPEYNSTVGASREVAGGGRETKTQPPSPLKTLNRTKHQPRGKDPPAGNGGKRLTATLAGESSPLPAGPTSCRCIRHRCSAKGSSRLPGQRRPRGTCGEERGEERGGPGGPRRRRGLWGRRSYCPRGGDWAAQAHSCTPSPPPHGASTHLSHPRRPCRSSASEGGEEAEGEQGRFTKTVPFSAPLPPSLNACSEPLQSPQAGLRPRRANCVPSLLCHEFEISAAIGGLPGLLTRSASRDAKGIRPHSSRPMTGRRGRDLAAGGRGRPWWGRAPLSGAGGSRRGEHPIPGGPRAGHRPAAVPPAPGQPSRGSYPRQQGAVLKELVKGGRWGETRGRRLRRAAPEGRAAEGFTPYTYC